MDPNTRALLMGAASGSADKLYIEDVFSTWLYTGNGSTQTITNGIDLSGKGGLVWRKARSSTGGHALIDSGQSWNGWLESNSTSANASPGTQYLAPQSSGFSIVNGALANSSGVIYASWTFRKQAKFFDVVTWTGDNVENRAVPHSLGSTPGCIIVKQTSASGQNWHVWHRSINPAWTGGTTAGVVTGGNATGAIYLNNTAAFNSSPGVFTYVNSTAFGVYYSNLELNSSGSTYVAYLFAHDDGGFGDGGNESAIKCGSYTGNGSTSGPVVDLGWEPQWLLVKRATGGTGDWYMQDNMRGWDVSGNNVYQFFANTSNAENFGGGFAINQKGFAVTGNVAGINGNGDTYIYIAIRRGPMKTPTDATKVFSPTVYAGTNTDNREVPTGIVTDMAWARRRNSSAVDGMVVGDRLRGQPYLLTGAANAEVNDADAFDQQLVSAGEYGTAWSSMTGFFVGNDVTANINVNTSLDSNVVWAFRRARGFFDIVAYAGTGVARTISHNLGVAPELILVKVRNNTFDWFVQTNGNPDKYLSLNTNNALFTGGVWDNTAPTSQVFYLGNGAGTNASGETYIAYLFASCPGVSKVGSYVGTGTTLDIDCGFTTGARLVIIKRTDDFDNWYCWDTARGITASNDPYLMLDIPSPEVTTNNYIGPLNTGFQLTSAGLATVNASGGSYIYLAIA